MIEDGIYSYLSGQTALTDVVSTRIYPHVAPTSAKLPYLVFQEIEGSHREHMTAASGLANVLLQVTAYAETEVSLRATCNAVRGELLGHRAGTWGSTAVKAVLSEGDFMQTLPPEHGEEQGVFQGVMQFRVWYRESVPTF